MSDLIRIKGSVDSAVQAMEHMSQNALSSSVRLTAQVALTYLQGIQQQVNMAMQNEVRRQRQVEW